jgi:hypothetical protein
MGRLLSRRVAHGARKHGRLPSSQSERARAIGYPQMVPSCPHAGYSCDMVKVVLMSVLFATFLVPSIAASGKRPLKALQATLVFMFVAELAYALFLRFLYGRFV